MSASTAYVPADVIARRRRLRAITRRVRSVVIHLALLIGSVTFVIPFLWMVSTSLKTRLDAISATPVLISIPPRWDNYLIPWDMLPWGQFIINSCIITFATMVG